MSSGLGVLLLFLQVTRGQGQGAARPSSADGGPPPSAEALAADTGGLRHATHRTPPVVFATRAAGASTGATAASVGPAAIHLNGRLDEPAWTRARAVTQFTQQTPREGEPATERTEVRIVYDDEAIYVAARMYDADPAGVRAQLARRDANTEADLFEVAFDSYHDHRTGFVFGVNPSGVKRDRVIGNDGTDENDGWDPVWQVATSVDSLGWTAELRIPLSQLRFTPATSQVWGVNFFRRIQRKAEWDTFAYSKQSDRGYASVFAHLFGIAGLPQPRRLELLPYATTRQERIDPRAANNPFNNGARQVADAGLDLKYGLTSGLTLDATFNPDFGQVDADPAYVNLTAFEQFLGERRPFFVEGASIFNFNASDQLFYSRRIGRPPQAAADPRGGFVDQPDHATILGAGKLSGKVGGWSLALLEAGAAREHATVDSLGRRFHDEVEPLTNYVVARGQRSFRGDADQLGFIGTAVDRGIDDPRLAFLRRSAYVGGVDVAHRFLGNRYNLGGSVVASRIAGDTLAIRLAQRSSARYFQRPDARTGRYDPTATSLTGWNASVNLGKEAGTYQFGLYGAATSPGFEVNDAGYQTSADRIVARGFVNRRWTRPGRVFRFAFIGNNASLDRNFDWVVKGRRYNLNLFGTFLNYWYADAHLNRSWRTLSDNLTRGGPLAYQPSTWNVSGGVGSDSRKRLSAYAGVVVGGSELGRTSRYLNTSIDLRPTTAMTISLQPSYAVSDNALQFVQAQADTAARATYGRQYVFARVTQHVLDLTTRFNVTFRPDLSLQLYTQPFLATGEYNGLKTLVRARSLDYLEYGAGASTLACYDADDRPLSCTARSGIAYYVADPDGAGPRVGVRVRNRDFASRSLRGNAVLRWEYRPGSTLFLVWTSSCAAAGADPRFHAGDDVRRLCAGPTDNVFALKANYWVSF